MIKKCCFTKEATESKKNKYHKVLVAALQRPPDKSAHFRMSSMSDKKISKAGDYQESHKATKRKQDGDGFTTKSNKKPCHRPPHPDLSLSMMFKNRKVPYDDDVWYTGQIVGFEYKEDSSQWDV